MKQNIESSLRALHGSWKGSGRGKYPTIDPFEFTEITQFEYDERYPLIHYEQRTMLGNGDVGHWESGFVRWLDDGTVELSSAQDGGRVEVLRGLLIAIDGGVRLELESEVLGHDDRLIRTNRIFELRGDQLSYEMGMSTTTTDRPAFQVHIQARLQRQATGGQG